MRYTREPTPISKRFTVFPYYGVNASEYYFTVNGESLYRIENDLSGNSQWVVARDMGTETRITTIDPEILEFWETGNQWSNITVIRPGRARKYQALAIPKGSIGGSDNNGPAWNAGGYTQPSGNMNAPYYEAYNTGINDLLIMGYGSTTVLTEYTENLPFATFYAVIDPVVIQYEYNQITYTRAIVNRVVPS